MWEVDSVRVPPTTALQTPAYRIKICGDTADRRPLQVMGSGFPAEVTLPTPGSETLTSRLGEDTHSWWKACFPVQAKSPFSGKCLMPTRHDRCITLLLFQKWGLDTVKFPILLVLLSPSLHAASSAQACTWSCPF